ncbi:MAG TPA: hypothetical protein VLA79_21425, partial [Polyangia bacterium]|nr:hypothetical protein [Polyangia bacterium]
MERTTASALAFAAETPAFRSGNYERCAQTIIRRKATISLEHLIPINARLLPSLRRCQSRHAQFCCTEALGREVIVRFVGKGESNEESIVVGRWR